MTQPKARHATLLVALLSAPVCAQVDWGLLRPVNPNSAYDGYERGIRMRREYEAAQAEYARQQAEVAEANDRALSERTALEEAHNALALGRTTATMVAEGRCLDAENLAVANGNFKLAYDIKTYCAAKK